MTTPLRVLLVEDSSDDAQLLVLELQRGGYAPTWKRVETAEEMAGALTSGLWDIVLSDYTLPLFSGLAALQMAKESDPDLPFIIVSGAIGEVVAVEAMRQGADDYLLKHSLARLAPAVRRELREAADRRGRREAEQAAHQLAAIIQGCDDAIWGKSLAGLITSWNPGAERLFGYTAAEIVGKDSSLLVPADRRDELREMVERIARAERIESFETERLRKDGTQVHVAVTVSPVTDKAGRVVGASAIARDITEKRLAEEAQRRQARLLQSVLASVGDGVAGADEQGPLPGVQ